MIAAALVVGLVAFARLMESGRWPGLDPLRARWRCAAPRAKTYVRAAPGTYVYLFVLLITTWVLQTSSSTIARQLVLERSTNLHQLARDPVRVLVSSGFWVSSAWELLAWIALFSVFVAPVEQWIGTVRTAAVFFLGHIGATLLTAAALWAALRADLVETSLTRTADVGASYGFFAISAVLTYGLPGRLRGPYAAVLSLFVVGTLAIDASFTAAGHLAALTIGFASYPLVRAIPRRLRVPGARAAVPGPTAV